MGVWRREWRRVRWRWRRILGWSRGRWRRRPRRLGRIRCGREREGGGGGDILCLGWRGGLAVQRVVVIWEHKMKRRLMIAVMAVPRFFGQLFCALRSRRQQSMVCD